MIKKLQQKLSKDIGKFVTVATAEYEHFGEAMPDGRLTEPSNGKVYRLREAIAMSKKLGRPLTEEEMKEYEI